MLLKAKDKKPNNIGELLIKPCLHTACRFVLGDERTVKKLQKYHSRMIQWCIGLCKKLMKLPFFSLQCDETNDISQHSQLLFYCIFYWWEIICRGDIVVTNTWNYNKDRWCIFLLCLHFLAANNLIWENVIGICNDGEQTMMSQ